VNALATGDARRIDAFRARFRGPGGASAERCFVNAASFGLGGVAALGVCGWCRAVSGSARYLAAAIPTLASGGAFRVTLSLDESPPAAFDITRIAPATSIEDGLADVKVVERVSLAEVAANLPILYSGALYSHPKVRHWRAARACAPNQKLRCPWNSTANPSEHCRSKSKLSRKPSASSSRPSGTL